MYRCVLNKLTYLYSPTDALTVEIIFVDFSHLVFITDLSALRVLHRPIEILLQTTNFLCLQENLTLQILEGRSNQRSKALTGCGGESEGAL